MKLKQLIKLMKDDCDEWKLVDRTDFQRGWYQATKWWLKILIKIDKKDNK